MSKLKQLFYIGKFSEENFSDNENEMIKEAEMFSVGTHRGVDYTEDDLKELVKNFNVDNEIPIQLDHSQSARDTVGYIQEASVKDGKLLGKLKIIDTYAKERIELGLMKKLSVSFYLKDTESGLKPHSLREVSLVAFPQVKSARLFSENGYVSDYEEEGGKDMTEQKIDLAELTAQITKAVEEQIAEQYSELQNQVEKLQGADVKLKETEIASKVEKFSADSKVIPAQKDALTKLMASFSEEQMTAFEDFMANANTVDFSEQGEFQGEDGEEEEKDERTKEQKEFDEFYESHTQKYGTNL